jgi:hypothetical protein
MRARHLLLLVALASATLAVGGRTAHAYTQCINTTDMRAVNHWPNALNTSNFGTQKWSFDWTVTFSEGLQISNVMYTSDLAHAKKLVMRRGSLPYLPVHYPDAAPMCGGTPHGFNDRLGGSTDPMCCAHVPTTPCNEPDRGAACMPASQTVSSCPVGAGICSGVCEGTQVDISPPIEDGVGETVSGASNADVVITAIFRLGGYQFVQRWRFQDNGTLIPSLRAGGVHDCQWHNHQIYWRFNFDLVGAGQNETIEECSGGGCPDTGSAGWLGAAGCGTAPLGTSWRMSDSGSGGRSVILTKAAGDGNASTFCENTTTECSGGCFNTRDFCALTAVEPTETFVANNCNDSLQTGGSSGADKSFWYIGHVDHHNPCSFLPMCDPALGTQAFGPTIRLVGAW